MDWNTRIKRQRYRINKEILSENQFLEYLEIKLYRYDKSKVIDYNLWELFREDFENFITEIFRDKYEIRDLQTLRAYLYCSNIYIENITKLPGNLVIEMLFKVLEQENMV